MTPETTAPAPLDDARATLLRMKARDRYESDDVEIDDDAPLSLPTNPADGMFVQAWVWLSADDIRQALAPMPVEMDDDGNWIPAPGEETRA